MVGSGTTLSLPPVASSICLFPLLRLQPPRPLRSLPARPPSQDRHLLSTEHWLLLHGSLRSHQVTLKGQ